MQAVGELLGEHPFFRGLDAGTLRMIEGCSHNEHVRAGSHLFREGDPADALYVLRHGRVALELHAPGRPGLVLDTVDAGDVVGWSWLVPPYRWFLDARACAEVSVIVVDASCLRSKCDSDPALGYALLQRVTRVMYHRLQSARVRLLDLYGSGGG